MVASGSKVHIQSETLVSPKTQIARMKLVASPADENSHFFRGPPIKNGDKLVAVKSIVIPRPDAQSTKNFPKKIFLYSRQ